MTGQDTALVILSALAQHGAGLALAAPLAGALACLVLPGPRGALACTVAALAAATAAAGLAAAFVLGQGPLSYVLADGLALRVDAWSALTVFAGLGLTLSAFFIGGGALLHEADPGPARIAFALILAAVSAAAAAAYAANLALMALALQLVGLTLAGACAVAGAHRPAALNAALRILTSFAAAGAFAWFGVGLYLNAAGGLDPAAAFGATLPRAASAGLVLVFLGLAMAGLIAPLNHWGPGTLGQGAQAAALLALTAIGPFAFVAAARVANWTLDLGGGPPVGVALLVLGAASALIGAFQALAARDLRRLAGYAFAAQAGCALLCLALATPGGAAAAALKIGAAALGAALLAAAGAVEQSLERLDGLSRRAPLAALCAALGCFVLMSAPFTLGYGASWVSVEAALSRGWWGAAAVTVLVSLAGVVFGGRILERMYFRASPADAARPGQDLLRGFGLALLACLALAAGFAGAPVTAAAGLAGEALILWPLEAAP